MVVQSGEFSDEDFLRAIGTSGARVLLIGRRAMILMGAPVMTADYDVWVHVDDIDALNRAFAPLDHFPNRSPAQAREVGWYVLENGERVDVIVARAASTKEGESLDFEAAWQRRRELQVLPGVSICIPCLEDLVALGLAPEGHCRHPIPGGVAKTRRAPLMDPALLYETPLPQEEFAARVRDAIAELDGAEGKEILEYVAWFCRRYPTPLAHLKYARRKYEEAMGIQALARDR
jgi:hypothetical protein